MTLDIEFEEEAFKKVDEESISAYKPEFKKFTMKFSNLDLKVIDAIAKRDKTSRSQIINGFIQSTLKDFLRECSEDEAYLIISHAEELINNSTQYEEGFSWPRWYLSPQMDEVGHFYNNLHYKEQQLETGEITGAPVSIKKSLDNSAKILS